MLIENGIRDDYQHNQTNNDENEKMQRILKLAIAAAAVLLAFFTAALFLYIRTPGMQYKRNINLGNKYLLAMQYDEAVVAFTKAIDIDPKTADAYVGRGDAYNSLGDGEKALDDYNKASELDSSLTSLIEARKEKIKTVSEAQTETPTETPTPAATADEELTKKYLSILKEYQMLQNNKFMGKEEDYPDVAAWFRDYIIPIRTSGNITDLDYQLEYTFYDINGDSVPELIFRAEGGENYFGNEPDILDVYTFSNNAPERYNDDLQQAGYEKSHRYCHILENGNIKIVTDGEGIAATVYYSLTEDSTDLEFLNIYREEIPDKYYFSDKPLDSQNPTGDSISKEEYESGISQYPVKTDFDWKNLSDVDTSSVQGTSASSSGGYTIAEIRDTMKLSPENLAVYVNPTDPTQNVSETGTYEADNFIIEGVPGHATWSYDYTDVYNLNRLVRFDHPASFTWEESSREDITDALIKDVSDNLGSEVHDQGEDVYMWFSEGHDFTLNSLSYSGHDTYMIDAHEAPFTFSIIWGQNDPG